MTNKISAILVLIIANLIPVFTRAQSVDEIEAKMDEIKLNESFIYGEDFSDNQSLAYRNALNELVCYANEIRIESGKSILLTSDLQTRVKELTHVKNGRHTVMVYILLLEMLDIENKSGREDVAMENGVASTLAGVSDDKSSGGMGTDIERERESVQKQPGVNSQESAFLHLQNNEIHDVLASQENWIEIRGLLIQYKQEGKIKATGNVMTYDEVPEDAHSILLDSLGGILAILSPKNSTDRIDYKTNLSYKNSNFTDCKFIVWYK